VNALTARTGWAAASVATLAGFVALWEVVARSELVSPVFLPTVTRTVDALVVGLARGELLAQLVGTVEHMLYGWLLASIAGIALGAAIGISAAARAYLEPMLEVLRPLPASAIVPVGIALFGLSEGMVLAVIAFGAVWPMLLATIHGFVSIQPRLIEVSRILRMSRVGIIFKIALPNAVPDILAGMRLSLAIALILAVVGEMLASRDGLGQWLLLAARAFQSADVFAGVVLLGAIGLVSGLLLAAAERWLLRWRPDR
jgi:ABC-type nitrate/sulfonate/bicarbonate transport system permease component